MDFSNLIAEYTFEHIDLRSFLTNAVVAAFLSWMVSIFYKKYGSSVSNRTKFAENFILLALTTMLIITIVKSSIALSLGLVGALSIVRFRAAIKEPEELVYLFLVIAIGLGTGAEQTEITILAFILIMSILIITKVARKSGGLRNKNQMQLSISAPHIEVSRINEILSTLHIVDLKRMSQDKDRLYLSYTLEAKNIEQIITVKDALIGLSPEMEVSFVDNKNVTG